jgi:hypothetical protein
MPQSFQRVAKADSLQSISNRGLIRTSCPDQVWGVHLRPLFSVISTSDREPISRRRHLPAPVLKCSPNYPETFTIDIPLTLKKDERFAGPVLIGR